MIAQARPVAEMISIEVDGIAMDVPKNSMIIEATDRAGISIPRFCYHPKLSIAANCRMCLVDVEKAPKPLPACATPVMEGMKVYTRSRRAIDAQHAVMEFLLINHPLDCPICDQGGECELQDLAMGYGRSVSRFTERKRVIKDKNVGPLIQTDMTRCIHCTRCVRFLEEVAGTSEMGGTGRGDQLEIGTCIERSIDSEMSGNIIDLCPVGALTNKPFLFSARAWELRALPSIAAHDGLGSCLYYHSLRGKILRAVPAENEQINESWLSDRDRYSHFGLYSNDRVLAPRVRKNDQWHEVSWEEGLTAAAQALGSVTEKHGASALGILMSAGALTEEYFLAQRLARGLGCQNIDHRLREQDFRDDAAQPTAPVFQASVTELEQAGAILLVGSNIRHEAPILGHRVRKAWRAGASISALNPLDWNFHFETGQKIIAAPQHMVRELAAIAKAAAEATESDLPEYLASLSDKVVTSEVHGEIFRLLIEAELSVLVVGQLGMCHPDAACLRQLAAWIAHATNSRLNLLPHGGNPVGAWLAGAVPHRGPGGEVIEPGLNAREMLQQPRKGYLLWDFEPDFDTSNPSLAQQALGAAEKVVAVASFATKQLAELADVILPLAPWAESEGTVHNLNGEARQIRPAGRISGASKPGWKILRRLGAELGLDGFDQVDLDEIRQQMESALAGVATAEELSELTAKPAAKGLYRVGEVPMYGLDALCRRGDALQQSTHADSAFVGINPADATALKLEDGKAATIDQGGESVELTVRVSNDVPQGAAWVRSSTCSSRELGDSIGLITVRRKDPGSGGSD